MFDAVSRPARLRASFVRYSRLAILGLLAPSFVRAGAAMVGTPVRGTTGELLAVLPAALFALAGAMAVRSGGRGGRRAVLATSAGFAAAGAMASAAYGSLQGLTGREPAAVVAGVVVSAFAVAFAVAGTATAVGLRLPSAGVRRAAVLSLGAGAIGGAVALLPFLAAAAGLTATIPYVDMFLAVVAAFGCVMIPFVGVGEGVSG